MATEASETLVQIRGRVIEKLSSLHLPSESLEAVRKTFETGLKGAYTTTVDAVQRTKQSLLDILPASLAHTNANEARRVSPPMSSRGRLKTMKRSHFCLDLFKKTYPLPGVPRSFKIPQICLRNQSTYIAHLVNVCTQNLNRMWEIKLEMCPMRIKIINSGSLTSFRSRGRFKTMQSLDFCVG